MLINHQSCTPCLQRMQRFYIYLSRNDENSFFLKIKLQCEGFSTIELFPGYRGTMAAQHGVQRISSVDLLVSGDYALTETQLEMLKVMSAPNLAAVNPTHWTFW